MRIRLRSSLLGCSVEREPGGAGACAHCGERRRRLFRYWLNVGLARPLRLGASRGRKLFCNETHFLEYAAVKKKRRKPRK
jgi:hypothetical protein